MTTIVPPAQPLPQVPLPALPATITVANPPIALEQLPIGALIDAEVAAPAAKNLTNLNSVFGKLEIKTNLQLPESTKLDLQVLRNAPQLVLSLKALNGTPIQLPGTATAQGIQVNNLTQPGPLTTALPNTPNLETPQAGTSPIKFDVGALIKATLLRPVNNPAANNSGPTPPQNQGQSITGTVKSVASNILGKVLSTIQNTNTNSPAPNVTNQQTTDQLLNSKPVITTQNQNPTNVKSGAQFQAGTQFSLKLVSTTPSTTLSSSSANPAQSSAQPSIVNGIVVANTPQGQPILNTPLGMMAIDTKIPLPTGQNLTLEILQNQTKVATPASAEARFESMFTARDWPNLTEAIREITQISAAEAQKIVTSKLPQPNTQLTSNTLFFLNALKGGDIQTWLGSAAASLLDQLNPELRGKLDEDFTQLGRAIAEPQTNEWRTALVPFFDGMGLEQFQMHTQGQFQDTDDRKKQDASRFIIDVELSRLGRIQLDGFVRSKGKRMDLIVRTDGPLPKQMRNDITKIYVDFSEATGVSGQITYQADQKFVEISMPQLAEHPNKGIVI